MKPQREPSRSFLRFPVVLCEPRLALQGLFFPDVLIQSLCKSFFRDSEELSIDTVQRDTSKCVAGLGLIATVCYQRLLMTSHLLCRILLAP